MYDYERVKAIIKRKGLQMQDIAKGLGVTKTGFIYAYKGQNRKDPKTGNVEYVEANPSVASLKRLADEIGCDVIDFFSDDVVRGMTVQCPHCKQTFNVTGLQIEGEEQKQNDAD